MNKVDDLKLELYKKVQILCEIAYYFAVSACRIIADVW